MAVHVANPHFNTVESESSPGRILPQKLGGILWAPMVLMALMGFTAGFIIAIVRANEIDTGGAADTIATLKHVGAGVMFIGFASVFAAIDFAIARILGEFREGGGNVQEASGRKVLTFAMPATAKLFIVTMVIGMMTLVTAVVLHFVFAADISNTAASLEDAEQRFIILEAVRRTGVAIFLMSFLLGLASIIQVIRFQSVRIRQLPGEPKRS